MVYGARAYAQSEYAEAYAKEIGARAYAEAEGAKAYASHDGVKAYARAGGLRSFFESSRSKSLSILYFLARNTEKMAKKMIFHPLSNTWGILLCIKKDYTLVLKRIILTYCWECLY